MFYAYILRSNIHPDRSYVGSTGDLRKRLSEHNSGKSIHPNKFKPWGVEAYVALPNRALAERFEKYLKTGSGRAFGESSGIWPKVKAIWKYPLRSPMPTTYACNEFSLQWVVPSVRAGYGPFGRPFHEEDEGNKHN